ncbi:hypothetical protein [Aurantimonas sp. VKM B-3413]|uniref:hypothetical protein n=1 Tax=Aurantimonas sp. VKM B-3413 TaxID=2779401 RepID=UPI001E47A32C|nr:hypothetical protein [Aurantimonas sp. VKM B-3413]MCB8838479.1 hypothetical protein [Aurantimonas sp. VKM B-3413]
MTMKTIAAFLAAGLLGVGTAQAEDLRPEAARSIALENVSGAAYYTIEEDGFRVVTTLSAGEASTPIRFVSTLADGQSVTMQIPSRVGQSSRDLTIRRTGDHVDVTAGRDLRASALIQ